MSEGLKNTSFLEGSSIEPEAPSGPDRFQGAAEDLFVSSALTTESKAEIRDILQESEALLSELSEATDPKERQELVLGLASMVAGLRQIRRDILVDIFKEPADLSVPVAAGALLKLEQSIGEQIPQLDLDFTSEEGVRALHAGLAEQKSGAYGRLAAKAGGEAQARIEGAVRSVLERLAGLVPQLEARELIEKASALSGKLALHVALFGIALLALGTRDVYGADNAASADVAIDLDQDTGEVEISKAGAGDIAFVTLDKLAEMKTDGHRNPLFEKLAMIDRGNHGGVNYDVVDAQAFRSAVEADSRRMAQSLFGKELKEISTPLEFITLINSVVETAIEYNHLSLEDTPAGTVENDKISAMPLDQIYLEYRSAVCRHYAALVEEVGELLMEEGLTPNIRGITIDEMTSVEQLHAWNVYYLNLPGAKNEVVATFTDATWHDTGNPETSLNARDLDHHSVSLTLENLSYPGLLLSQEEVIKAFEQLLEQQVEGIEGLVIARTLVNNYYYEADRRLSDLQVRSSSDTLKDAEWTKMSSESETYFRKAITASLYIYSAGQSPALLRTSLAGLIDLYILQGKSEEAEDIFEALSAADVPEEVYAPLLARLEGSLQIQ